MITSDVMPFDPIVVNIVENPKATLPGSVYFELSVVGLADLLMAGVGPGGLGPRRMVLVGGGNLGVGSRPEPAFDVDRLQIFTELTTFEVTETARRPDVRDIILLDEVFNHLVLLVRLNGDRIHTLFSTFIPCDQPINLGPFPFLILGRVGNVPREVVRVATELPFLRTLGAFLWNWKT